MPIKCIVDLVAAVDKTGRPPLTEKQLRTWVKRWRKKEAALYSDKQLGEREAKRQINALEISNIVELIDARAESNKWGCRTKKYPGSRHPVGRCGFDRQHSLTVGVASIEEWDLGVMKSCDIKKGDKRLLITFREDEYGEWGVSFGGKPPHYISCRSLMRELGFGPGSYTLTPIDKTNRRFSLTRRLT